MISELMKELTQEKVNEKQVLKEFGEGGKFKVYNIYPGAMMMLHGLLDGDSDLNSPEVIRNLFVAFTNFVDIDPQLLEIDIFKKLLTGSNQMMKDITTLVLETTDEACKKYIEAMKTYNELPESQKIELVKFFKEAEIE